MIIKILVTAHKPYWFPENAAYLPLQVGAAGKADILPGIARDDSGENISERNRTFCELTGLFWAWKNLDADIIGLCHYRRYFQLNGEIMDKKMAECLLKDYPVILPVKRNYYIETAYTQYIHAHGKESIDTARQVIIELYPEYLDSFDKAMNKRSLHIYNMFVMRKDIMDDYCKFLFDVLFKVEERITVSDRIFGYLGERLLDVYILKNNIRYWELPVYSDEKINWPEKIWAFFEKEIHI